jgi:uncharacterized protein (TIGR02466 family)
MSMQYDPLFSSVVGTTNLQEDNNAILEYCLAKQKESEGRRVSNVSGWQSNDLVYEDWKDIPAMCSLWENLGRQIEEYRIDNGLNEDARCFIYNWWINISPKDSNPDRGISKTETWLYSTNIMHVHPHSYLSGVYYVKCDSEVHSGIRFSTPLKVKTAMWGENIEPTINQGVNYFTASSWLYKPEASKVVLFPSWLEHSVGVNKTDDLRVSISINILA